MEKAGYGNLKTSHSHTDPFKIDRIQLPQRKLLVYSEPAKLNMYVQLIQIYMINRYLKQIKYFMKP